MKHVSELANQVSRNEQPTPAENGSGTIPNRTIINLWERLNHIYGHKFSSTYGESAIEGNNLSDPARTWASGLRGVTGEQIADGLRECINCGESWPPALPEFVKMCKGSAINEFGLDYIPEYHRETIRRPDRILSSDARDEHRKEIGTAGVAGLKAALGKN